MGDVLGDSATLGKSYVIGDLFGSGGGGGLLVTKSKPVLGAGGWTGSSNRSYVDGLAEV